MNEIDFKTLNIFPNGSVICSDPRYGGLHKAFIDTFGYALPRVLGGGAELPGTLISLGVSPQNAFTRALIFSGKHYDKIHTHTHESSPYCDGTVGCGHMAVLAHDKSVGVKNVKALQNLIDTAKDIEITHDVLRGQFEPSAFVLNNAPTRTVFAHNSVVVDTEYYRNTLKQFVNEGFLFGTNISGRELLARSELLMQNTIDHLIGKTVPKYEVRISKAGEANFTDI